MLTVISPAKTLDFENPVPALATTDSTPTIPDFLDDSQMLIEGLRKLAPQDISALMGISDKLGLLNYDRFRNWRPFFTEDNAKPALLAFKGDVYTGLEAEKFDAGDFSFAQQHLRILSGLYGLLRPLDLMQAYRLEMGTRFKTARGADLYSFWGDKITLALNSQLQSINSQTLVNLASNEYFKSVRRKQLDAEVVTPVFKDMKGGQYKVISFFAKKARGMMSAFIIRNRLHRADQLLDFKGAGYSFNPSLSKDGEPVFTRDE